MGDKSYEGDEAVRAKLDSNNSSEDECEPENDAQEILKGQIAAFAGEESAAAGNGDEDYEEEPEVVVGGAHARKKAKKSTKPTKVASAVACIADGGLGGGHDFSGDQLVRTLAFLAEKDRGTWPTTMSKGSKKAAAASDVSKLIALKAVSCNTADPGRQYLQIVTSIIDPMVAIVKEQLAAGLLLVAIAAGIDLKRLLKMQIISTMSKEQVVATQSSLAEHFVAIARIQMKPPTRDEDYTHAERLSTAFDDLKHKQQSKSDVGAAAILASTAGGSSGPMTTSRAKPRHQDAAAAAATRSLSSAVSASQNKPRGGTNAFQTPSRPVFADRSSVAVAAAGVGTGAEVESMSVSQLTAKAGHLLAALTQSSKQPFGASENTHLHNQGQPWTCGNCQALNGPDLGLCWRCHMSPV